MPHVHDAQVNVALEQLEQCFPEEGAEEFGDDKAESLVSAQCMLVHSQSRVMVLSGCCTANAASRTATIRHASPHSCSRKAAAAGFRAAVATCMNGTSHAMYPTCTADSALFWLLVCVSA